MVKVALDALGGDFAPDVVIEGAVNAVNKNENLHVVLCGPEAEVKAKLEKLGYTGKGISVVDAPDPVAMDEHHASWPYYRQIQPSAYRLRDSDR